MTDITFGVTLKADGSGLVGEFRMSEKASRDLREAIDTAGASAERSGRALGEHGARAERAAKSQRRMAVENRRATSAARALTSSLSATDQRLNEITAAAERAARGLDRFADQSARANRSARTTAGGMVSLRGAATGVGLGLVALETRRLTGQFFGLSDAATRTASQLRNVTDSEQHLVATEERLFDLTQETRSQYEATVQLYARVARSSDSLGVSQRTLFEITEAANKAIQISGASATEAQAGVIQFAQGLASGELRGEELRSVMEQLPRLAQALVDGLDGVDDVGALREMAENGELTTEKVIPALLSQLGKLRAEFLNIERTSAQAATQLRNEFLRAAGIIDDTEGATSSLGDALDEIRATVGQPEFRQGLGELVGLITTLIEGGAEAVSWLGAINAEISQLTDGDLSLTSSSLDLFRVVFGETEGDVTRAVDQIRAQKDVLSGLIESREVLARQGVEQGVIDQLDRQIADKRAQIRGLIGDLKELGGTLPGADFSFADDRAGRAAAFGRTPGQGDPGGGPRRPTIRDDIRDEIDAVYEDAAAMKSLTLAYGENAEAVREAEINNEALNIIRKAGTDLSREEYEAVSRAAYAYAESKFALNDAKDAYRDHQRTAEETADAHREAVAEIRRAGLDLADPYTQAVAAAEDWREEALEGLDETRVGYEAFARDVERIYREMLINAQREHLSASREWSAGVRQSLRDYADEATNAALNAERVTTNALRGMEDAFVQWATTGKLSAKDLVNSILADLARLTIRQSITGPLAQALLNGFPALFGGGGTYYDSAGTTTVGVAHTGGEVGAGGLARREVSAALFADAPRFHIGGDIALGPRERPIIAEVGEKIFTPEQLQNGERLFRTAMSERHAAGREPNRPVAITNNYDFRGADAGSEARLREHAERIKTEAVAEATEAVLGRAKEGGKYAEELTRVRS